VWETLKEIGEQADLAYGLDRFDIPETNERICSGLSIDACLRGHIPETDQQICSEKIGDTLDIQAAQLPGLGF